MFELKISTLTDSFEIKLPTLVPSLAQSTGRDSYFKEKVDDYLSLIEYILEKNQWRNLKGRLLLYNQEYILEEMSVESVIQQLRNVVKILNFLLYKSPYTKIFENIEFTTTHYEQDNITNKSKFEDILKFFNVCKDLVIVTAENSIHKNFLDWKLSCEKNKKEERLKTIKYENYSSLLIINNPSSKQFEKLFLAHLNIAKQKHAIK